MKIIINDYFKLKQRSNLIIFLLEYKRKIIVKFENLKKEGNDAYYYMNNFQYCKYKINLINFKNINYQIIIDDKQLISHKTPILYFDFINKETIKILTKNEYNESHKLIKSNRYRSSIKFWHLFWNCLHYLSYNYPENPTSEDKEQIINLINKMKKDGISCSYCRAHFKNWCSKNDILNFIDSKNDLINFFINLHNDINNRNDKIILSKNEIDKIYLNFNYNLLVNYGLDIINLFEKRKLDKFPDILNSHTRHILLDEFNIIKFA
tara:strand:+ start:210 stop:1004 length:795 start_codon:yes stop_codon:yes gene_type:complete